jgi:hypothetical protein
MLVTYGVKRKKLSSQGVFRQCTFCDAKDGMSLTVFQNYFQVYEIPIFPLGKYGAIQCSSCNYEIESNYFNAELKHDYENAKRNTRTPLWTFIGTSLLIGFIAFLIIMISTKEQNKIKYLASPQVGDMYEVKYAPKAYTLYKIHGIKEDTLLIRIHYYETNNTSGLKAMKKQGDDNYSPEIYAIPTSEFKKMYDDKQILAIHRP